MSEAQAETVQPDVEPGELTPEERTVQPGVDPDELTPEERSALYSRWFDVALDIDRLLLTLSLACFGVLGTVLAGNVLKTKLHYGLWVLACSSFLLEIVLVLSVVFLNKRLLTKTLLNNRTQRIPWLDRCECASRWLFFVSIFCTAVFLGALAYSQFDKLPEEPKQEKANERKGKKFESGHGGLNEHASAESVSEGRTDIDAENAGNTPSSEVTTATSKSTKEESLKQAPLRDSSQ